MGDSTVRRALLNLPHWPTPGAAYPFLADRNHLDHTGPQQCDPPPETYRSPDEREFVRSWKLSSPA